MQNRKILTVQCADQPGIVRAVTETIFQHGGNIVDSAQHSVAQSNTFCLRMEIDFPPSVDGEFDSALRTQLATFDPQISLRGVSEFRRVILMVSKVDHCLLDILYHWEAGDLPIEIVGVVSNHETLMPIVEAHEIPFFLLPVTPENKSEQEARLKELVRELRANFIVLARYMQVLSNDLCATFPGQIINIHHSFLPGFKGARPYHQAYERGVKIIGATAHYVTADLDEGPIIEQDVARTSHRHDAADLVKLGRDTERRVLTKAVRLHAEDRIMLTGAKTVIFD